jgi:hypothetical protein
MPRSIDLIRLKERFAMRRFDLLDEYTTVAVPRFEKPDRARRRPNASARRFLVVGVALIGTVILALV